MTGLTYRGVTQNGFVLDDVHTVVDNRSLDSLAGASQWLLSGEGVSGRTEVRGYRPIVMASYALDRAVWGDSAAGYHVGNLLIHAAVVVLAFLLARRLWGDAAAAFVAALVVALHPLNAEAVNYIAARSSSLMALWILLSVWCYDRAAVDPSSIGRPWGRRFWLAGALIAGAAALGTKEAAVVLPLLIVAWDRARAEGWGWKVSVRQSIPFWVLAAALLALRAGILGRVTGVPLAGDPIASLLVGAKLVVVSFAHWFWPTGLAIDYAWPRTLSSIEKGWWVAGVLGAATGTWGVLRYYRRAGWCLVWFWVSLLPILPLPFITGLVLYQEHRSYLGGIGLAWAAGGVASLGWRVSAGWRVVPIAVLAGLCAAAVWADAVRTRVWRTGESVWEDSLAKYPNSTLGHNARAMWLTDAGRLEEARIELERSLAVDSSRARTHSLLGIVHALMGRYDRAIAEFELALIIAPTDPSARTNLGRAYEHMGRTDQALAAYERVLQAYPKHAPALGRSGVLLERAGRLDEAASRYRAVVALDPTDDTARETLGVVLLRLERWSEAEGVFTALITRHPDSGASWFNLGVARERSEQYAAAEDAFRRAAALAPQDPDPEFRIGMIHARRGQWEAAAAAYERAIARDPSHALSHFNLASEMERRGDVDGAAAHYRTLLAVVATGPEHEPLRSAAEEGLARLAQGPGGRASLSRHTAEGRP
jgi:tetratricopeptide (TPR) repeat protein